MTSLWLLLRRCIILTAIAGLSFILWQQLTEAPDSGGGEGAYKKATALPLEPASVRTDAPRSDEIPARDLFVSIAPPAPPAPLPVTPVAPAFTLVGTGIGPPSFALIRSNGNGAGLRVLKGMKVEGWDIVEIRKNNLVLSRENATWIIGFSPEPARLCSSSEC